MGLTAGVVMAVVLGDSSLPRYHTSTVETSGCDRALPKFLHLLCQMEFVELNKRFDNETYKNEHRK